MAGNEQGAGNIERRAIMVYTVNVAGNVVRKAKEHGWHAYYANGVTAIEIPAANKKAAKDAAEWFGWKVLYVFL